MTVGEFLVRWRVRLGYLLAAILLALARPTPLAILLGGTIGLVGLAIRGYAAGYLHKQEILTTAGPYAYTRNPLYFGSSFLALGAAVAMQSWTGGVLLLSYFLLVYSFVMRREEGELRARHAGSFDAYAAAVPLFFPQLTPLRQSAAVRGRFSVAQYKKNHEYEAAAGFFLLLMALILIWRLRAG